MKKPFAQYLASIGEINAVMISDVIEKRVMDAAALSTRRVLDGLVFEEHEIEEVVREILDDMRAELRK